MNIKALPILFCLSLCASLLFGYQTNNEKPPNFVVIFTDDLGYGDLSVFGHPTIHTPNIDQMAQEGMKLTQFYVAASICTPSRSGLLTGKLPIRTGTTGKRGVFFPDSGGGLLPSETTIAKALKKKDYRTACIGKWHLGHLPQFLPTNHGFDYYYGIPYSNDMSPATVNWDYAKEAFPELPLMENEKVIALEPDQSKLTAEYTKRSIEFIKENKDHPFFLYLPHSFPHTPLFIDDENKGRSKRGLYGDVVELIDDSVGEILKTLKEEGLEENTFVIFTSDNGPWDWRGKNGGSAGLLKGAKGSTWEGGFRVPTIVKMPGTIPENTICDAIGSTLDLFPTIMEMAGIKSQDVGTLDGESIWSTFTQQKEIRDEIFYYRERELFAYRKGNWKIHLQSPFDLYTGEKEENKMPLLFDLNVDPSEKYNVAEEHADIVEELTKFAAAHVKRVKKAPSQLDIILPEYQATYDKYFKKK